MEFTKREMEMAKDMKEVGLKRYFKFGDVVLLDNEVLSDLHLTSNNKLGIITGNLVIETFDKLEVAVWNNVIHNPLVPVELMIWVPLYHQCRKILASSQIIIQQFDLSGYIESNVEINCYRELEDGLRYNLGSVRGETDLDALYQAILLFVLPEKE